ncbi:MAG: hypothetical protein AAFN93_03355 [Bacteroidota bacterium]
MAKKQKGKSDKIEDSEELNSGGDPDINDIDDSFGLPDIDYKPLDELDDTPEEVSEEVEETVEEVSDTLNDAQEEVEENVSEEVEETADEVYAATRDDNDLYQSEEESQDSKSYDELEEEAKAAEKEYIPGSYTPPKDNSNAGTVVIIILLILALLAAGWYFGIYRPGQAEKAEIERVAQQKAAADKKAKEDAKKAADAKKAEEERQRQEEAAAAAAEEEANKVGTVETISSRTNRYYVVVASNIDGDLAMDYGKKISQEAGVGVTIIEPFGNTKFHRIAVDAADTFADAQSIADELKGTYGDGVWVIKY